MAYAVTQSICKKKDIWLLGQPISNLKQNKLPLNGDSLRLVSYHHVINKKSLKKSIKLKARAILNIWDKATIPTFYERNLHKKLERFYPEWQNL